MPHIAVWQVLHACESNSLSLHAHANHLRFGSLGESFADDSRVRPMPCALGSVRLPTIVFVAVGKNSIQVVGWLANLGV